MSSDTVIAVEGLGKKYRIQHQQQGGMRYRSLRDVLADKTKSVVRRLRSALRGSGNGPPVRCDLHSLTSSVEDFWALKDVSFEIRRGETLGIIGRNGAGKSTLLKILSRITEPSAGRVKIDGRVASLLEVGTGFHPELTGRENIFLNGAILGMSRKEIRGKFDEIVAFAEVEQFLDTPVKRYSSGMYVRLAFAVAAHLEPEILVVDEVLAVGDAEFQRKCLGKMEDVSRGGRTILFVSHNLAAISHLCRACILLVGGQIRGCGRTSEVLASYTTLCDGASPGTRPLSGSRFVESATFMGRDGKPQERYMLGDPITIDVVMKSTVGYENLELALFGCSASAGRLVMFSTQIQSIFRIPQSSLKQRLRLVTEPLNLLPGSYRLEVGVGDGMDLLDYVDDAGSFVIEASDYFATGNLPGKNQGFVAQRATWALIS